MKVVLPVIGDHVGNQKEHGHIDEHDDHIKEGILSILIGINSLDHPTIDQNQKCHQETKDGI